MSKERLLAFSDGVIAIIITIMVLEPKPPHQPDLSARSFVAIPLAFADQWLATAIYTAVALLWLVPDRRIERALAGQSAGEG